jgi:hypothetical protein
MFIRSRVLAASVAGFALVGIAFAQESDPAAGVGAGGLGRAELVDRVASGIDVPDGQPIEAGGLVYVGDEASRIIPDLPGLRPGLTASPEHFGAHGDGGDDTAALAAAFRTGAVALTAGRTYGFTSLSVPPGTVVHGSGAVLRYLGPETRQSILRLGEDTVWDRLTYRADSQSIGGVPSIVISAGVKLEALDIEAGVQLNSMAVAVEGGGVEIGVMRSRRFGRPLMVGLEDRMLDGFRLGWHDFENIVRGIRMMNVKRFEIGGGRQAVRSPLAAEEHPGRNNLLLSGISHGRFGPMDLGDAPEHAIRFGGQGKMGKVSEDISFAPLTIRRAGASAVKINPGKDGRVRNIRFAEVNVFDPFQDTGDSASASHLIRISHADDITIEKGSVRHDSKAGSEIAPGIAFAIADSTGVEIGPFVIYCCMRKLVAFLEDIDWSGPGPYRDIHGITFRGLQTTPRASVRGAPIQFRTCGITVSAIEFEDLRLHRPANQPLFDFGKCPVSVASMLLEGEIGKIGPATFRNVPRGVDLRLDLDAGNGQRLAGEVREVRERLGQ